MDSASFLRFPWSSDTAEFVRTALVVPAGMIILYFWGKYHFNEPVCKLELEFVAGRSGQDGVSRLIQAPPRFTTTRSHFNSYALGYVFLLEGAYLISIFAYPIVRDIVTAAQMKAPDLTDETLQTRAIFTLLVLTGVLSSFPGLKQIDSSILAWLHKAALIPDSARALATKLYESEFKPSQQTITEVRKLIVARDVKRVADGETSGALERRLYELLCLRTQIATSFRANRYQVFSIKLNKDLQVLSNQTMALKEDAIKYFKEQDKLVRDDVSDIDAFIAGNLTSAEAIDLAKRRNELQNRCEILYESECLVIALALFATTTSPEELSDTIRQLGLLDPDPYVIPNTDWDCMAAVTVSVFLLTLVFIGAFALVGFGSGFFDLHPELMPEKSAIVRLLFLIATAYLIVMWLALRMKRRWRSGGRTPSRPENLIIALLSYICTAPLNLMINLMVTHGHPNYAFLLYALNQAVLGYFIAEYIDRAQEGEGVSWWLAGLQGFVQAMVAVLATSLSQGVDVTLTNAASSLSRLELPAIFATFSLVQAFVTGLLVGALFQHFYRYSRPLSGSAPATVASGVI